MSTRFFHTALTTGMAGSSIDPDLAASLKARDRHDEAAARAGRAPTGAGAGALMRYTVPNKALRCAV